MFHNTRWKLYNKNNTPLAYWPNSNILIFCLKSTYYIFAMRTYKNLLVNDVWEIINQLSLLSAYCSAFTSRRYFLRNFDFWDEIADWPQGRRNQRGAGGTCPPKFFERTKSALFVMKSAYFVQIMLLQILIWYRSCALCFPNISRHAVWHKLAMLLVAFLTPKVPLLYPKRCDLPNNRMSSCYQIYALDVPKLSMSRLGVLHVLESQFSKFQKLIFRCPFLSKGALASRCPLVLRCFLRSWIWIRRQGFANSCTSSDFMQYIV